jgi:G3E family GTPase
VRTAAHTGACATAPESLGPKTWIGIGDRLLGFRAYCLAMPYQEPEFLPWDGRRVPITFVGGYLGAGKTTVINDVLRHADRPVAVIVNDMGSINIDARLVRRRNADMIEVTNGCVCCSSIDGMGAAFDQIRARPNPPDHVIVELSGVAEPQRMVPWGQSAGFMLDSVVVVVAADQLLPGTLPTWVQEQLCAQITAADLLVLTKTDLVDEVELKCARLRLSELAQTTPAFVGRRALAESGSGVGGRQRADSTLPPATLFDAHEAQRIAVPSQLTLAELHHWLDDLPAKVPGLLVRAKGVVATIDAGVVLVQVVGNRREVIKLPEPEDREPTDLVVVTLR